jgi:hypothetical protein
MLATHHGQLVQTTGSADGRRLLVEVGIAHLARVAVCDRDQRQTTERDRLAAKRQHFVPSIACHCAGDCRDKRSD